MSVTKFFLFTVGFASEPAAVQCGFLVI